MVRKWIIPRPDADDVDQLARDLRLSPLTSGMLVNRGLHDSKAAASFLSPSLHELKDPADHAVLREAARFLADAVRAGRHITVFGDYDADGICATALLLRCLRGAGAKVDEAGAFLVLLAGAAENGDVEFFEGRGVGRGQDDVVKLHDFEGCRHCGLSVNTLLS